MINVSYGITVCNENKELANLLNVLNKYKKEGDEIVVVVDRDNHSREVLEVLRGFGIKPHYHSLNKNFAEHKNFLNSVCTKDFIFSIDADEEPNEMLMENLHSIIEENDVDLIFVPRINTVEGITEEHINKWGWRISENGWVNFPDYQRRVYRNNDKIKWKGDVHEVIVGFEDYTKLPAYEELSLYHHKTIEKQEKQNEFYDEIG